MMNHLNAALITAALMTACTADAPAPKPLHADYTLSATHAFDTSAPIAAMAFSPNDVASWLGAIAMVSEAGQLLITNIEGKSPNVHSDNTYTDVIGTNRKGAPALFLALTDKGELRPFIEADNEGTFKSLPISTDAGAIKILCKTPSGISDRLTAITAGGEIVTYSVAIDSSVIVREVAAVKGGKSAEHCAVSNDTVYTLSGDTLAIVDGVKTKITFGATGLALQQSGDVTRPVISRDRSPVLTFHDAGDLSVTEAYDIQSGLSIAGLGRANAISATASAFGGSGFNAGIIAMADTDANRVVILSGSYVAGELDQTQTR